MIVVQLQELLGGHYETRSVAESGVVRHELYAKPDCSGSDPPIGLMDFLSERVSDLLAPRPQLGAHLHEFVVGLDDNKPREVPLKSPSTQLSPVRFEGAVSQLGHRGEGDHDRTAGDQRAV